MLLDCGSLRFEKKERFVSAHSLCGSTSRASTGSTVAQHLRFVVRYISFHYNNTFREAILYTFYFKIR